jgi:hypothetical protein
MNAQDAPPAVLQAWLQANQDVAMRTAMMRVKMLPGCDFEGLESSEPLLAGGVTAAIAAIVDLAALSGADSFLRPPGVPWLNDYRWQRSVDSWTELRRGALSPAAIHGWLVDAVTRRM